MWFCLNSLLLFTECLDSYSKVSGLLMWVSLDGTLTGNDLV